MCFSAIILLVLVCGARCCPIAGVWFGMSVVYTFFGAARRAFVVVVVVVVVGVVVVVVAVVVFVCVCVVVIVVVI